MEKVRSRFENIAILKTFITTTKLKCFRCLKDDNTFSFPNLADKWEKCHAVFYSRKKIYLIDSNSLSTVTEHRPGRKYSYLPHRSRNIGNNAAWNRPYEINACVPGFDGDHHLLDADHPTFLITTKRLNVTSWHLNRRQRSFLTQNIKR